MVNKRVPTIISAPSGAVLAVNQRKLADKPIFLLSNPPSTLITIPRGQSSQPVQFSAADAGPLTIVSLAMNVPTRPFKLLMSLQDGQSQRMLMNTGIHSDTIMGDGVNPFKLPEVLVLREARSLVVVLSDLSIADDDPDNVVRISALSACNQIAQTLSMAQAQKQRTQNHEFLQLPFFYALDGGSVDLTASGVTEQAITISETAHFQMFTIAYKSTGAFSMQIVDAITGEELIEQPIGSTPSSTGIYYGLSSAVIGGTGKFPFKFHEPRTFKAGSKLRVFMKDLSGAPNTVYLTLGGRMLTTWL